MKETNRIPKTDLCEEGVYQTGSTNPPKSHRGLIAVLLVLVIFLGGIVSGLGIMNIHLFRLLQEDQPEKSSFRFSQEQVPAPDDDVRYWSLMGLSVENIPRVHQHYYDLPQGLYISSVTEGGVAYLQGIQPGDVLTELNGKPVAAATDLDTILKDCFPGETVSLVLYRTGTPFTVTFVLE